MIRPYMKYGDWYVPYCDIKFETDEEAMRFIRENYACY